VEYDTDQYAAPETVTYKSVRVGRQNVVGVVVRKTVAGGDVGNVEDDAEAANDDECDADDC